jgi:glycosyltransferase involved in cell wall biosynthesis
MIVALIPCLNEKEHITSVLVRTTPLVDKVVVRDDGSSDLTSKIAGQLGASVISHETNLGKRVALSDLFKAEKNLGADIAVTLDGDGQHAPAEISKLAEAVEKEGADVVIGSRETGDGMPGHRKVGNRVPTGMTNAASGGKVIDSQSGFRAYSRRALETIAVAEHGIGVDSQVLVDAFHKGLKVEEVPVKVAFGEGTSTYESGRHGL